MKFLFDTDHISIVQREQNARKKKIFDRLAQIDEFDVAYSVVSFHEQVLGAHSYLNRAMDSKSLVRGYRMLDTILETFAQAQVLRFEEGGCGTIRGFGLAKDSRRVDGSSNRRHRMSNDLTLVTTNTRDFGQVPGLRIEDWTT